MAGITVPVQLEAVQDGVFRIISGFRRISAAILAGMAEVPAIITETDDPLLTYWRVVQENHGTRELHDLEKAGIILKLKEIHLVEEKDLLALYLPGIGLKGNRHELDRHLTLASLSGFLKESCFRNVLLCGTAVEIRNWPEPEQRFFAGLAARYRLGVNKQKQLLRLLDDLKKKERTGLEALWNLSGLQNVDPDEINFERIHQVLTERRFPVLADHQAQWEKLRESLHLNQGIRLQAPRYFDGDTVTVTFSAASPSEFRDKAGQLLEASRKKELEEIYSLL